MIKKFRSYFTIFAMSVVILSSCRNEYTCTCKDADGEDIRVITGKDTPKNAKESCDAAEQMYQNGAPGATCELD